MTTSTLPQASIPEETACGAASPPPMDWHQIDWSRAHRNVRRLQARIVKATQAGRWGKVQALQHLLTHSYSGKVLAVRRVTENAGHRTAGVDGVTWKIPEQKMVAVHTGPRPGTSPCRCWLGGSSWRTAARAASSSAIRAFRSRISHIGPPSRTSSL
jgi:hypothetical protein